MKQLLLDLPLLESVRASLTKSGLTTNVADVGLRSLRLRRQGYSKLTTLFSYMHSDYLYVLFAALLRESENDFTIKYGIAQLIHTDNNTKITHIRWIRHSSSLMSLETVQYAATQVISFDFD